MSCCITAGVHSTVMDIKGTAVCCLHLDKTCAQPMWPAQLLHTLLRLAATGVGLAALHNASWPHMT